MTSLSFLAPVFFYLLFFLVNFIHVCNVGVWVFGFLSFYNLDMYFDQIANMRQAEEVATRKTKIQLGSPNAFE